MAGPGGNSTVYGRLLCMTEQGAASSNQSPEEQLIEAEAMCFEARSALGAEFAALQVVTPDAMFNLASAFLRQSILSKDAFPEDYNQERAGQIRADEVAALLACAEGTMTPTAARALWHAYNEVTVMSKLAKELPTDAEGLVDTSSSAVNAFMNLSIAAEGIVGSNPEAEAAGIRYCLEQRVPQEMLAQEIKSSLRRPA